MNGTHRVADATFNDFSTLLHGFDCSLDIPQVIERIEYTKYIDSHIDRFFNKALNDVIGVMPVADTVLSPQQHLEWRVRDDLFKFAGTFPRIFVQEAKAGIERCPTPSLEREKSNLIQLFPDRQHVLCAHPGGQKGLMGVS